MKSRLILFPERKKIFLTPFLLLFCVYLNAQLAFSNNNPTLSICKNSGVTSINNLLNVSDPVSGETLTWSVVNGGNPPHGTLSNFPATATSNGTTVTPSGLGYKPSKNATGSDAFTIQVTNGTTTVQTTVNVTINPPPAQPVFTVYKSEVYPGEVDVEYTVAPDASATSYNWIYTGSGVSINNVSTSNSMTMDFAEDATDGTLLAQASGACGNSNSASLSIKILSTLPVTYLSFTATQTARTILLNWSTASEVNSKAFIIQRSYDNGAHWQAIGNIAAAGTSVQKRPYRFIDSSYQVGTNLYRLKQVDLDNSFKYSKTLSVIVNAERNSNYFIYPNPAYQNTWISTNTITPENLSVKITDMNGQLLLQTSANVSKSTPLSINLSSLNAGLYLVKISSTTKETSEKLVVVR